MSFKLNDIVNGLVNDSPLGELAEVRESLQEIVPAESKAVVTDAIDQFIVDQGVVISGKYIASKHTKDTLSSKFWDYISKQKFNVDSTSLKAIDIEEAEPNVKYPDFYNELTASLAKYGDDHYPSEFAFTAIPQQDGSIVVVIIGQKVDKNNFYSGSWKSVYSFGSNGSASGDVKLDIHYYEDGNVRLEFGEKAQGSIGQLSASDIVNYIYKTETAVSMKIMDEFTLLNQKYFKNLRRLLPVTKSKINWGKAIGTYRLGSDVVNKK